MTYPRTYVCKYIAYIDTHIYIYVYIRWYIYIYICPGEFNVDRSLPEVMGIFYQYAYHPESLTRFDFSVPVYRILYLFQTWRNPGKIWNCLWIYTYAAWTESETEREIARCTFVLHTGDLINCKFKMAFLRITKYVNISDKCFKLLKLIESK